HHRCNGRYRIGLEQIGRHARAITDVVADVVGNRRGIARIIFWNAGLHFADEVTSHVRALREDPATKTSKDRDKYSDATKSNEPIEDMAVVVHHVACADQETKIESYADQR